MYETIQFILMLTCKIRGHKYEKYAAVYGEIAYAYDRCKRCGYKCNFR